MTFTFDRRYKGIVLADMLHYLPASDQRVLIERCIDHLDEGGVLVIRDGDKDLRRRHRGTRYTEFFSTRLYGFNKTRAEGLTFFSFQVIRDIAASRNMECTPLDKTRFTSNVVYVLRHKNSVHAAV
jgi:hypothetical protein